MKKITENKLQLKKIVIARLSIPKQDMFGAEPGQSTLPHCDPLKPPTVSVINPGISLRPMF
jgi:hypothetical protein